LSFRLKGDFINFIFREVKLLKKPARRQRAACKPTLLQYKGLLYSRLDMLQINLLWSLLF